MHIMIDLETMAVTPDAPIVSIGACRFDENGLSQDTFYRQITLQSSVDAISQAGHLVAIWASQRAAAAVQ